MSGNLQLLAGALARAKQENRAALISGMTAGFPTVNDGIAAIQAMLNSGADIVAEQRSRHRRGRPATRVRVLDRPVIQAASDVALRGGVRIADVIRTVRESYQATGKPVLDPHRRAVGVGGRQLGERESAPMALKHRNALIHCDEVGEPLPVRVFRGTQEPRS